MDEKAGEGVKCPRCGEVNYEPGVLYCWSCGCHLGGCVGCENEDEDRNKDCCWYCSRNPRKVNRDMYRRKSC